MSKFLSHLDRIAEHLESKGKNGYVSEYTSVAGQPETHISDLSTPKGLIAWNKLTDAASSTRLICYWLSKGDYEREPSIHVVLLPVVPL